MSEPGEPLFQVVRDAAVVVHDQDPDADGSAGIAHVSV
jgi:hypothetical protein